MNQKVSIVIPVYNEEVDIENCLATLSNQSYTPLEIIIVDDGSIDTTLRKIKKFRHVKILTQKHKGPATARNLGAKKAKGEILVFVDADMTFDKDFIRYLVRPILKNEVIGTFSREEMVANKDNPWSICWNLNRGLGPESMHPKDYPDTQPVFRAILKKEFDRVGGFDNIGYTDDWTLSRKLGVMATNAAGAIFYHQNPDNLQEIWKQARWIGKNEFISGSVIRKIWSLWRYGIITSAFTAVKISLINRNPRFVFFKLWYDVAVWVSVLKSFFGESKVK